MPFNKLSGQVTNPPMLPVAIPAGGTFYLPAGQGVIGGFGAVQYPQIGTNNPVSGQYILQLGQYSNLQQYDQGMNYWQTVNVSPLSVVTVSSDGTNYRIANSTGCPVGAVITGAGTAGTNGFYGYVQGPGDSTSPVATTLGSAITIQNGVVTAGNTIFTITPSAGGSLWNAIVGGAINATMTFSGVTNVYNGNYTVNGTFGATVGGVLPNAGALYTKPPLIVFSPPASQGIQPYILPTAVATIAGGVITAITVIDQGAGMVGLPGVTVVPQPGDTTGGGAIVGWLAANNGNTGTGTLLAMWPGFYGTALTATPTFTFGGTSNPAPTVTAIMNYTVTGVAGTAGAGYGTTPGGVVNGGYATGTPAANTVIRYAQAISIPQYPQLNITTATGVPTLAGPFQGVNLQAVPVFTAIPNGTAAPGTANANTFTVGGITDVVKLLSF